MMPMDAGSLSNAKGMEFLMISQSSIWTLNDSSTPDSAKSMREALTLYLQASPVNHSAQPESNLGKPIPATNGPKLGNAYAEFDRVSHSWKTFQALLPMDILEESSVILPKAGIVRDGVCYRLPSWEPTISAPASGLLPTLKAIDYTGIETSEPNHAKYGSGDTLTQRLRKLEAGASIDDLPMYPTLTAFDANNGGAKINPHITSTGIVRHINAKGKTSRGSLQKVVKFKTLQARDYRTGSRSRVDRALASEGQLNLNDQIGGLLNPDWCDWLMGFPIGYSALKGLETPRLVSWLLLHGEYSQVTWISGYEGLYAVTVDGGVYSFHGSPFEGKLLSPRPLKSGYLRVTLSKDSAQCEYLIHRLVLEAFMGPCPNGYESRHLNGKPADNRLGNLAWGTPTENNHDKVEHGTAGRGEKHSQAKLTEADVLRIKERLSDGETHTSIAKDYSVTRRLIGRIANGQLWSYLVTQ